LQSFLDQMAGVCLQDKPYLASIRKLKRPDGSRRDMHYKFHATIDTSANQSAAWFHRDDFTFDDIACAQAVWLRGCE
jgi:hypothetical protein